MFEYSAPPASHYVSERREFNEKVKQHAIACSSQLEGWCPQEKMSKLIDLVLKIQPEVVVEIGVWGGRSLIPMAFALKANKKGKAYGIDPWSRDASLEEMMSEDHKAWWSKVDYQSIMQGLKQKIGEFELEEVIELIQSTSEAAPPIYGIDLLYIDGNHSEKISYFDVTKWVPLMKKGGVVLFDDITWFENGVYTTARAVEWLNKNCMKLAEFEDVSVWGMWVKI